MYGACCRLVVCLTIVHVALRAVLLLTATDLSGRLPTTLVQSVGALPSPSCLVDLFRHAVLHGGVWNGLLMPNSFYGQALFEGSRGVFSSIIGPECLLGVLLSHRW